MRQRGRNHQKSGGGRGGGGGGGVGDMNSAGVRLWIIRGLRHAPPENLRYIMRPSVLSFETLAYHIV